MADRLRIVYFNAGGMPVTELDLSTSVYAPVRDSLAFSPPTSQAQSAASSVRFGGSRVVSERHENGTVAVELYINGGTANASMDAYNALLRAVYSTDRERYIEWRPDGVSYSVFWELRGPGVHEPKYRWIEFQGTRTLHCAVSFTTAPLAEGARMGVTDTFDSGTTLADNWTYVSGGGNGDTVSGGALVPGTANPTTKRVLSFTERGYAVREGQVDVVFTGPSAASTTNIQVSAHLAQDGSNLLEARISDNGTNSQLGIYRNGTLLGSAVNLSARVGSSERYLLRLLVEGNVVTAYVVALSGNVPAAHRSAYYSANAGWRGTATVNLTPGTQNPVDGYPGLSFTQQGASNGLTIDEFDYRPFVVSQRVAPTEATFPQSPTNAGAFKALPGDAPPRFDFSVSALGSGATPFGMVGWFQTPKAHNLVPNGNFEDNGSANYINGWIGTAVSPVTSGTSTLAVDAAAGVAKFATRCLHVTTPATSSAGATCRVYGQFRKGRTYTVKLWARLGTGASAVVSPFITDGTNSTIPAGTTLTSTYQQLTASLTLTADANYIDVGARIGAATVSTFRIDGVQLYDSSNGDPVSGPTGAQAEGWGALPPLGFLQGGSIEPNISSSNWTVTADAAAMGGYKAQLGTPTANVAYPLTFTVDPNLVSSDDYTQGELSIEVWARVYIPSTYVNPYFVLSSTPSYASGQTVPTRYSEEWQGFGKVIPVPTVSRWTIVRLGTLTFTQDQTAQRLGNYDAFVRQYLTASLVAGSGSTGNAAVDYLACVPSRSRASTPSGKALDSSYPEFIGALGANTTSEAIKFVDTNLAADFSAPGQHGRFSPDLGLGGAQLVIPRAARTNFLLLTSNIVPDNPYDLTSADAITGAAAPTSLYVDVIPRYFYGRGS